MYKQIIFTLTTLTLATALVSCATPPSTSATNTTAANFDDGVTSVQRMDTAAPKVSEESGSVVRQPAQESSTHWIEDSKSISIQPSGGTAAVMLSPRQVLTETESYRYTCEQYGWGVTTCEDYTCSGGVGQSQLWNDYYAANGAGKANALDKALAGVSGSARRLDQAGVFRTKARSWREFRERMNDALKRGLVTDEEYKKVFGEFGQRNRDNLGYSGSNCQAVQYSCTVYGLFSVQDGCEGTRTHERVINVFNKPVTVTILNPVLQSFENESITVSAGPNYDSIRVGRADKTDYRLVSQNRHANDEGADFVIEGVGRQQIGLPAGALQGVSFNDARGVNLSATVSVDPRTIGQGDDKLIFMIQATHCTPGGFWTSLGDCKGNDDRAKVKMAPIYTRITQAQQVIQLPGIASGEKVWITYQIQRENSKFYNNVPVAQNSTKIKDLKQ